MAERLAADQQRVRHRAPARSATVAPRARRTRSPSPRPRRASRARPLPPARTGSGFATVTGASGSSALRRSRQTPRRERRPAGPEEAEQLRAAHLVAPALAELRADAAMPRRSRRCASTACAAVAGRPVVGVDPRHVGVDVALSTRRPFRPARAAASPDAAGTARSAALGYELPQRCREANALEPGHVERRDAGGPADRLDEEAPVLRGHPARRRTSRQRGVGRGCAARRSGHAGSRSPGRGRTVATAARACRTSPT